MCSGSQCLLLLCVACWHVLAWHAKKVRQVTKQRNIHYQAAFLAQMTLYNCRQLVWIDETGCDHRDHVRKFGYSLRARGHRVSTVAAMTNNGIIATNFQTGSVGKMFWDIMLALCVVWLYSCLTQHCHPHRYIATRHMALHRLRHKYYICDYHFSLTVVVSLWQFTSLPASMHNGNRRYSISVYPHTCVD